MTHVSYAGTTATLERRDLVAFNLAIETWYVVNPAAGTNPVTVLLDTTEKVVVGTISVMGAHQSDPIPTSNGTITDSGTAGPQTVTITTQFTDSLLVSFCMIADPEQPSEQSSQTPRWGNNTTGNPASSNTGASGATKVAATIQAYDDIWTWTGSEPYGIHVIEVRCAPEVLPKGSLATQNVGR